MGNKQKTYVGTSSSAYFGFGNTMACYRSGSYDNTFPNVSRIAETFMTIQPYAINDKGERLPNVTNLIAALYNPNREMSGVDFFEALMVMALVHPTVYILCWRKEGNMILPGGQITEKNIAGFTFLENPSVIYHADSTVTYRQGTQEYNQGEVLAISMNVNPYSILGGYSPSLAAKKWSNTDDYIADYQAGYFRNGAIPAGEFVITAPSPEEFNDIVDELQRKHRGAGNNNNAIYVHRPTSLVDGKPLNAQIEWVPFGQSNKDLTLQSLFDQANKKIDMAFGVPQEIKGYLQNSNYASANVAEKIFDKYVVAPKALKIWTKFTHEMNRVTGGLGYAIGFDFEVATLTDEEKVKAETTKIQLETLNSAIEGGFSLASIVDALELPENFNKLEAVVEAEEAPEVVEDVKDTASQAETSLKSLKSKATTQELDELVDVNPEIREETRKYMSEQIEAQIEGRNFNNEARSKEFAKNLLKVILGIVLVDGLTRYDSEKERAVAAGADPESFTKYEVSEEIKDSYQQYLDVVALSYTEDTADSIRRVLAQGDFEGWEQGRIEEELRNIMNTDEWRVRRLARTEQHRADLNGSLDAMRQLKKETGLKVYKVWHLNPESENHCEDCEALDGTRIPLDEEFGDFPVGDTMVADAHPNCVLGDTEVLADGVQAAYRYNYSGDVIKITTANGRSLSVTPNHILLTDKGWVRAKNITESHNIVAYSNSVKSAIFSADPTKNDSDSVISKEFSSLWESGKVATTSMPLSAIDFKGDGIENEEVDIILSNGLLRNKINPSGGKFGSYLDFVGSVDFTNKLSGFSSLNQTLVGVLLASSGIVSSFGESTTLVRSEHRLPDFLGFAGMPDYYSRLNKSATNSATIDSEFLSKSVLAQSRIIEFDNVVSVERYSTHNTPVYDLQTYSTLYLANGIVSSNCGCFMTFEFDGTDLSLEIKSVKVTCPHCNRYMFETTGGNAKNVICANSKCKKHWNIEVKDGVVNAEECK